MQIKACYPLLRGRLHIMMKGLALSSCERITHCCSGRTFFFFTPPILDCFCASHIKCAVMEEPVDLAHTEANPRGAFARVGG